MIDPETLDSPNDRILAKDSSRVQSAGKPWERGRLVRTEREARKPLSAYGAMRTGRPRSQANEITREVSRLTFSRSQTIATLPDSSNPPADRRMVFRV